MREELNAYEEMIAQTSMGQIAACVPIIVNDKQMVFVCASDPNGASDDVWVNDPTDYSGWEMGHGEDFFGHEGIGLAYAVAMIRYAHALAKENGLNPVA